MPVGIVKRKMKLGNPEDDLAFYKINCKQETATWEGQNIRQALWALQLNGIMIY